jgi:hypothetical protein
MMNACMMEFLREAERKAKQAAGSDAMSSIIERLVLMVEAGGQRRLDAMLIIDDLFRLSALPEDLRDALKCLDTVITYIHFNEQAESPLSSPVLDQVMHCLRKGEVKEKA